MAHRICTIGGDGIGREVVPAAVEVLRATGLDLEFTDALAGLECFERDGDTLPAETLAAVKAADATLFGAITTPTGKRPKGYRSSILTLRQELGLYANLRPARSWPVDSSRAGVDMLIVRENTEGLYVRRETLDGDTATAERRITREASLRIGRAACRLAQGRRRHLTIVHKANVLPVTCGLFRDSVREATAEFEGLTVDEMLVDAMAMRLVKDPEHFDVIVTTNMFGDILSDEAAAICGGMGLAPSANIGPGTAVFEPVHGSAPDIAGQGIANPYRDGSFGLDDARLSGRAAGRRLVDRRLRDCNAGWGRAPRSGWQVLHRRGDDSHRRDGAQAAKPAGRAERCRAGQSKDDCGRGQSTGRPADAMRTQARSIGRHA